MYKNISITHSLLILPLLTCPSLLSMEQKPASPRPFNPMEQSLYIEAPTEKGYGVVGGFYNLVREKEDNVLDYLSNKTFNTSNEYHRADLNTAVQNLISNKQPEKLCTLLAVGKANYAGQIKINDEQAIAAHNFLATHTKQQMEFVQQKVEAENKLPLDELTKNINELTKSVSAHLVIIRNQLTPNVETSKTIVAQNGDQIRAIQTGLVNLRYLSNLKSKKHLLEGGAEQDENKVKETYSNDNISKKIENSSAEKRTETRNINKLSRLLTTIEEELAQLEAHMKVIAPNNQPIATEDKK